MSDAAPTTVVHKFGGWSLADASCIRRVAEIIAARPEARRIVVVSAMSGVTDSLVGVTRLAASGDGTYPDVLETIRGRHLEAVRELFGADGHRAIAAAIERDLGDVRRRAARRERCFATTRARRSISCRGYGEVWSAQILDAVIRATRR